MKPWQVRQPSDPAPARQNSDLGKHSSDMWTQTAASTSNQTRASQALGTIEPWRTKLFEFEEMAMVSLQGPQCVNVTLCLYNRDNCRMLMLRCLNTMLLSLPLGIQACACCVAKSNTECCWVLNDAYLFMMFRGATRQTLTNAVHALLKLTHAKLSFARELCDVAHHALHAWRQYLRCKGYESSPQR